MVRPLFFASCVLCSIVLWLCAVRSTLHSIASAIYLLFISIPMPPICFIVVVLFNNGTMIFQKCVYRSIKRCIVSYKCVKRKETERESESALFIIKHIRCICYFVMNYILILPFLCFCSCAHFTIMMTAMTMIMVNINNTDDRKVVCRNYSYIRVYI